MTWCEDAINLIKQAEGCRLEAYPDPATGSAPWTIGYGATGPKITPGTKWTQVQAEADLKDRVEKLGALIDSEVKITLTDEEKAALIDFTYNVGNGNLEHSTLLRLLNSGDIQGAANEFPKWNLAAGKVLPGLVKRRDAEKAEFLLGANFTEGLPT